MQALRREVETPAERASREHVAQHAARVALGDGVTAFCVAVIVGVALLPVGMVAAAAITWLEQAR